MSPDAHPRARAARGVNALLPRLVPSGPGGCDWRATWTATPVRVHGAPAYALGIGMADVTTDRLVRHIDWEPTRVNALSSGIPSRVRVPAHFASDRECLQWVAASAGKLDPAQVTYGWIRNTLELGRLAISHNLRARIDGEMQAQVEGEIDVKWDAEGNLVSPFVRLDQGGTNAFRFSRDAVKAKIPE
jgi:hypothetical protein